MLFRNGAAGKTAIAEIEYGILLYNQIADFMNELTEKIYAGKTNMHALCSTEIVQQVGDRISHHIHRRREKNSF